MSTIASRTTVPHIRESVRQINRSNLSAGISVLLLYLFAGLPIQIGVMTQLGLSPAESSSWFFVTWMTTGLFSFGLALFTKQPVSIKLSIPALIFLAGAAGGYSLPQIIGANLLVGVVAIGLSTFRVADAFARLFPGQVAIGVFAGSMLLFMLKTSQLAVTDIAIAGPILAGFVLTLAATRNQLLAVALAAAVGLLGVLLTDGVPNVTSSVGLPEFFPLAIELHPAAMIALGIPPLILVVV
ncbi:MAG: benzoate/H(+) symporter BenE family transporter [SAR202 cluster bacterium]|nr:benzoate/H(+) symporter BenE family transporter [SAR202 cluster bacterium]